MDLKGKIFLKMVKKGQKSYFWGTQQIRKRAFFGIFGYPKNNLDIKKTKK